MKAFAPDDAALDILALVLANDKNSRLYKKLVYDLQIAQTARAFQESGKLDGKFQVDVTPMPGQKVADIDKVVKTEIANIIQNGISTRELQRAQNSYKASSSTACQRAGQSGSTQLYNYFVGTPDYVQQDAARYERVTAAESSASRESISASPRSCLRWCQREKQT